MLERDWVQGEINSGLGVAVLQYMREGDSTRIPRSAKISRWKMRSLAAIITPKNSASALDNVTERCILLNQWKGQPA